MERSFSLEELLPKSLKKRLMVVFLLIISGSLFSQNTANSSLLRFPLWFVLEEAPSASSVESQDTSMFTVAAENIRELAPFFIEGLVFGWEFSYTPSDATRGVDEYFEMSTAVTILDAASNIRFTDSVITSNVSVVESWVEYTLSDRMVFERNRWYASNFPSVGGRGDASVFEGVESIRVACEQAAKSAIREYARNIIKNKPKEINGKILLTDFPRYYIDAGKYVADLDFFLNVSKIVEYTKF